MGDLEPAGQRARRLRNFERRRQSVQKRPEQCWRGLKIHLYIYIIANGVMGAANLLATPTIIWALWPLLIWGLGWFAHAFIVYRKNRAG